MPGEILIPAEQKGYQCEIIADSVNPAGVRLTTMRLKYPLIVHGEMTRHRCFSRSVASNRAIPTERIIAMVEQDPFVPIWWGRNQPGMQAEEELGDQEQTHALVGWLGARDAAVEHCRHLAGALQLHKQIANRLMMPFQWVTEVITGTDWANFFALRCHPAAQPEVRKIAEMMRDAYRSSSPDVDFHEGDWHLPFIWPEEELDLLDVLKRVSAARCARTSYQTHEGKRSTIAEDLALFARLAGSEPVHASPTEHQAEAMMDGGYYANFRGWRQFRSQIPGETVRDAR